MSRTPDLENACNELLRLHANAREAHFANDADLLLSDDADPLLNVRDGEIEHPTRAERTAFFRRYFDGVTYHEWDDLEPPIVRVSEDASLGWLITRLKVRRHDTGQDGRPRELGFVYAGIETFEKRDGAWVRTANVSTFSEITRRPLDAGA